MSKSSTSESSGTLAAISRHEPPERIRARRLDRQIEELTRLRDEIDPMYKGAEREEKPKGRLVKICSMIASCFDILSVSYLAALIGIFGLIFLYGVLEAIIKKLF